MAEQPPSRLNSKSRPTDSKGWDGKLRIDRSSLTSNGLPPNSESTDPAEADSDPNADSNDEDETEDATNGQRRAVVQRVQDVPGEEIAADEDLAADFESDTESIDLIHCRISHLHSLKLERFTKLRRLCLRQNQIKKLEELPTALKEEIEELDVYDNLIKKVGNALEGFERLKSLDLSFNDLKKMDGVGHLVNLTDLYFVQNRIRKIEGLEKLSKLRNLELGGNKITEIEGLEQCTGLEELWLGKNRITELKGLSTLSNLTILSIQANRLHTITGLDSLTNLEELHISHNALTSIGTGLSQNTSLRVIDISSNPIKTLEGLETLTDLEELWASNCQLESFEQVEKQLADKEKLTTVYFEGNPLQRRQPALYRNKVQLSLPRIKQIDAMMVSGSRPFGGGTGAGG